MAEPAKPITQLAVPIDRAGRRGPNRLGRAALQAALWPLPVAVLGSTLFGLFAGPTLPAKWVAPAYLVVAATIGLLFPAALATAIGLAIGALVQAANRHVRRREAITAIAIAALLLGLWSVAMFSVRGTMLGV